MTPDGSIIRTSSAGAMLTKGGQGQPVLEKVTTNKSLRTKGNKGKGTVHINGSNGGGATSSIGFQQLNTAIVNLDAIYDLLPNKALWVAYAASVAGGWHLCANCQPDSGPKKLFRQINFNRQLQGLPILTVPPPVSPPAEAANMQANVANLPSFGLVGTLALWNNATVDTYIVAICGKAQANPSFVATPGERDVFSDSTAAAGFCAAVMAAKAPDTTAPFSATWSAVICVSTPGGVPGLRGGLTISYTHE